MARRNGSKVEAETKSEVLYAVRARSIYRTSRADVGKPSVWLVKAADAETASALWALDIEHNHSGEWVFESIAPHAKQHCVRIF